MTRTAETAIQEEAERRFARQLARDCPPEERAALAEWICASPAHAQAYEAVRETWKMLAALRDHENVDALRQSAEAEAARMRGAQAPRRTGLPPWLGWSVAAGVAAAVLGTLWLERAAPPVPVATKPATVGAQAELATVVGEVRTETLPDGSSITLNTHTEVETRVTARQREVRLRRGEAVFEVRRDTQRPFVVAVGGDTVTALGTRFQVREEGDESTVTLFEGSVRIHRASGSSRVLEPGEQARLDRLGGIVVSRDGAESTASWTHGWLVFRDEPLLRVVAEVNRYADRPIRLSDPALGQLRLSGNFRVGDSTSMASAMAALLPLNVVEAGADLELHRATPP